MPCLTPLPSELPFLELPFLEKWMEALGANAGILFRPPENVIREFPQFPVTTTYDELGAAFVAAADGVA